MLILYSLSIFCGAALLFLVQPMFARFVLPSLGGSPAVWNTALVFYQTALLAGYAWTHFTVQKLGARRQAWLHCGVLALALFFLPIALPASWTPPTQGSPSFWLLGAMLLTVGPPFFAVSTTSPALQRWFATTNHPAARDPYFLYAASNAGSLLALVAYPFILEPRLRLLEQSRLWAFGFGALLVLCLACAFALWKSAPEEAREVSALPAVGTRNSAVLSDEPITLARRLRWIALAAVPSSLMVGVTTYLSNEIAAIPLLWIVPLVLYLLSFIIVFSRRGEATIGIAARIFTLLVLPLLVTLIGRASSPMNLLMPLNLLVLFVAATMCHGELARDRPAPARLTEFYLLMSLGGALGGAFNALLAPVIFKSVLEYPLALAAACALVPAMLIGAKEKPSFKVQDVALAVAVGATTAVLVYFVPRARLDGSAALALTFGPAVLVCFAWSRKPARFGLAVLGLVLAGTMYRGGEGRSLRVERSFFGIHRVTISNDNRFHQLIHGNTLHGSQALDPKRANDPLTYYYRTGPIGQVFEAMQPQLKNVGVVGLGVGSLAPYGRVGQSWTYYEIDPEVEDIARTNFTFLKNCRADLKVILGDARLSLKTAPQGGYDLLALDAYSSDAIPVHLMTREAMQLYLRSLAPRGVLAFHISNRHLDLEPVLGTLARDAGLVSRVCNDTKIPRTESRLGKSGSQWMILARRAADFGPLQRDVRWTKARVSTSPVWTDDYSSLLPALTWR
ncbi:MAG TPA: fused MFS/spermidine synthase [Abditibacteriaceae bacterium]